MEDRKTMASVKIAALAFCLMLFLGSALASEYPFGSKVLSGDSDVGRPTLPFAAPQVPIYIAYWDVGSTPGLFDANDIAYLHFGIPAPTVWPAATPAVVRVNDIRLTPFGNLPAGSKVTTQDNDIGMQLHQFLAGGNQIGWLDLYGIVGAYDLQDPVIINILPPAIPAPTALNDIRLTESEGLPAGTKIRNSDPDLGRTYGGPAIATNPMGSPPFRFFDANGNGLYDDTDDVYLHPVGPMQTAVLVNDVRISGPQLQGT